jgi:hypothetical protein
MKIIQQDLLTVTDGIIFHQVNCLGIMGGGIAYALARKFPNLERDYREICKLAANPLLGKVFLWRASDSLCIANIFGQEGISRNRRMTSYDATCNAFEQIKDTSQWSSQSNHVFDYYADRFFFPYKMGCGLGGGNWDIYSAIIDHYFPDAIVCKNE